MTTSELSSLESLFMSPNLYIRDMDWKTCEAVCLQMSRSTYSRSTFLDHRTIAAKEGEYWLPISSLMDAYSRPRPDRAPPMFVAHTAFCGSTLLTRCLDLPGICMPYREPYLFHNLSVIWRLCLQEKIHRRIGRDDPSILDLAIALFARTYGKHERSVVKLSDSCTSLLPSMLARSRGSRILLLHHELRRFLVAMLRSPERREYVRNMRVRAEIDLRAVGRQDIPSGPGLSDGRCAAVVWMGLMYPYLRLLSMAPNHVRSLNAEVFLRDPLDTLTRLDDFMSLNIGVERLKQHIVDGAMSSDAKIIDQDFDKDRYKADLEHLEAQLGDEIADAIAWMESVSVAEPLPVHLPNPL